MTIMQNFIVSLQDFLKHAVQAVTKAPKAFVCTYTGAHIIFHIKTLKLFPFFFFHLKKPTNEKHRPFSMKYAAGLQRALLIHTI